MYTLILIIVGLGTPGSAPQLASTSFPVSTIEVCRNMASELSKNSTQSIQIHTYCVPR